MSTSLVSRLSVIGIVLCGLVSPAWAQVRRAEYYEGRRVASQEILVRFKATERVRSHAAAARDPDIVQTEPLGRTGGIRLRSRGRTTESLLREYSRRSDVEYVEPNYLWHASDIPNDLFIGDQWGLRNTGQYFEQYGIPGSDVKAIDAWNITEGSRDIVVGVLDTGVDYNHPDLAANIWTAPTDFHVTVGGQTIQCLAGTHGFDAISRTCDPIDSDGHGTHISGIIAAAGNNGSGISGINRVGSVIALKFLDADGTGSTSDAIAAIEFAVEVKRFFGPTANIRVLNASWGSPGSFSQLLLNEINLSGQNDMLFVASSGNDGQDNDFTPHYPSSYDSFNIVSVAAVDNRDELIPFSNVGRTTIDLGAPGAGIVSTLPTASPPSPGAALYGSRTGTSMSAPFVSGAAALVLSACAASTAALKDHLLSSVDPLPSLAGATVTGGRVNVYRALTNCLGGVPDSFAITATPGIQTMGFRSAVDFAVSTTFGSSFSSPISLELSNAPSGMSWSFNPPVVNPGQSSILQVSVDATVSQRTYTLRISGTDGINTRTAEVLITIGLPLSPCAFTVGQPTSGNLESIDIASIHRASALADYCQLTIDEERPIRIVFRPTGFASQVYLLSSSGDVLAFDDNSDIERILQPGVYILELTTSQAARFHSFGSYTLTASLIPPSNAGIMPYSLTQGTDVSVQILGNNFYGPPFTVEVTSCQSGSVTVTDVNLIDPNHATAIFHVSPDALGSCNLRVMAATGTVNGSFQVLPPPPVLSGISPSEGAAGETVSVTITGSNFKPQMSVNAGFISVSNLVITSTTSATARFSIPSSLSGGHYSVTLTNNDGTVSNPYSFLVKPGVPILSSISPQFGLVGATITLTLTGRNLATPLTINAGDGISVSNVRWLTFETATAVLTISSSAAVGPRDVTVTTPSGTSGKQVFSVVVPPTLTGIDPSRVIQGIDSYVTVSGANLNWGGCQIALAPPNGGLSLQSWGCELTRAHLGVRVPRTALVGDHTITISNAVGSSNPVTLRVDPRGATLTDISPLHGPRGGIVQVTLTGTDFVTPLSINVDAGITVSNVIPGSAAVTATFSIDASAATGEHVVSVTTPVGGSNSIAFIVTPVDYVDLVVSQSQSRRFALGQIETFSLAVRNIGLGSTSGTVTVTDEITPGMDFVSGEGPGWVCVRGAPTLSGASARCTYSSPLAPGQQSTITLTVRVYAVSEYEAFNTVRVEAAEDFFPGNNISTEPTQKVLIPAISMAVSSNPFVAAQQATVRVLLAEPYPYELVGKVDARYDNSYAVAEDPAMQFSTGGRTANFTIPANTTEAVFPGTNGPVGFQPGTVGSTFRFTASAGPPTYYTARETSLRVDLPLAPPTITKVETEPSGTGFTVRISGFATARAIQRVTFRFDTEPNLRLVCGSGPGCTVNGSAIVFDISSIVGSWFGAHSEYGSLFNLRVPFTVQGKLSGSVIATIANTLGTSNAMSFPLP